MRFLILSLLLFPVLIKAQPLQPLELQIPMRDSESLAADVYIPSGCTSCPTILIQTPYNKNLLRWNLPLGIGLEIDNSPYVVVVVDWRGFWGSVGALNGLPNRGEDGYDCVEWIADQSWSNGKVGTWGPSALGNIQYQTARENPPHLTCCVPVVSAPQTTYKTYYPGGVLRTEYIEQLDALGFGVGNTILSNPYYNLLWQGTENTTFYPEALQVPFLLIGGWFDHNIEQTIDFFNGMLQSSSASSEHKLLVGPWTHGGNGEAAPGTVTQGDLSFPEAENWNNIKALEFFEHHLLEQQNGWQSEPRIRYFQMGMNQWEGANDWSPVSQSTKYYLGTNSTLSTDLEDNGMAEYITDPKDPSPTVGGPTLNIDLLQGPFDISTTVEMRTDHSAFETPTLSSDLSVQGKINVKLFVSTDQPDGDVAVRLTEVFPNGESILLRDGIQRLRFRNGFRQMDEAFCTPNEVYEINIELEDIAHTFSTGNKIRLLISGANYPRFDVNLNNGDAMYTAGDTITATSNIHFGTDNPSRLELPVVTNVSVEEAIESTFSIYPNPATDVLWVEMGNAQSANVRLVNVVGKEVRRYTVYGSRWKIDVHELANGIYFLQVKTDGLTEVIRFVKE